MKKLIKILAGILVVFAILIMFVLLWLDSTLLKGFNAAAPDALGVPASLQDLQFRPLRGKASLEGLHIGNPEGFKTDGLLDVGSVSIRLDPSSLTTDTIIINEITIDDLVVTFEKGLLNNNLNALVESLSGEEDPEAEAKEESEEEEKPEEADKPAKKVIIEKLSITGSKMNVSMTAAMGVSLPIPLPPIILTDLGKESEGITVVDAIREVLSAIAGSAGTAIANSSELIGKTFGAVGDGAWAVGEGAVDAGKAVVGGAADTGKAVVGGAADAGKAVAGGAVDAGKAVGDGLKNLNPFKKKKK